MLEVRPDRLPPEYEPQPHQNHHVPPPRPPLYTYHNMSGGQHAAFTLPGHLTPFNGPAWLPGQLAPQRPQVNMQPGSSASSQNMYGSMSMPGMSLSPHPPPMSLAGPSPMLPGQSPSSMYGTAGIPLPMSGQNTGNHVYQSLGASPLAGSLTAGTVPPHSNGISDLSRRESFTPFAHSVSPDPASMLPSRSTSPIENATATTSRPTSSPGRPVKSSSSPTQAADSDRRSQSRANPPGYLGSLPPPMFAGVKTVISPTENGYGRSRSTASGGSPPVPHIPVFGAAPPLPLAMEGLAHQGSGLGPPSTLHDRVVFVSNVSVAEDT